jgi:uncharacterized protein
MAYKIQRYIQRNLEKELFDSLESSPVTGLLGPRQCGKSTLARHLVEDRSDVVFLDLERPSDLRKLEDPEFFFHTQREKLICIDEVQQGPELFPVLRAMVDQERRPGRFLLLGSASQDLIRRSSETLAGRIHYAELTPFIVKELKGVNPGKHDDLSEIWVRGGFPDSVLASTEKMSLTWRMDFIRTFLERDIPQFGFKVSSITMRRFWSILAHYHGQIWNASKTGQALNLTHPTMRNYLNILEQTYMVRVLPPFIANIKKRLIKSPKVYLRDSGLLHALLEIGSFEELMGHPVVGASWEGFCLEQIMAQMSGWRASYYRTSSGEELDLVMERGSRRLVFEFKASMSPRVSRGFPGSLELLKPDKAWIVAPVLESYSIPSGAVVTNLQGVLEELEEITD